MMRKILFLIIIITSCSENHSSQGASTNTNTKEEPQSLPDTTQVEDLSSVLDEQNHLFELIEKYNESGDTKNLQGVLDHWESGLKEEYIATFTPLYCGLVSELMGDKKKAKTYYEHSKKLALDRMSKPLDDIKFEYGVNSEEELTKMFRLADSKFDVQEFKSKKIIIQKYWLYISQIALGENKFNEFNNLNMVEIELAFLLVDFDVNKREDIFHLITGWND